MSNQCGEPREAGHGKALAGIIGKQSNGGAGPRPARLPRSRRSMIGVVEVGEEGRLAETSRRRALRLRAAIVLQLKQGKLPCLFGLPCLKLLAAEFRNPPPAQGVAIDHNNVGLGHGTSCGVRFGDFLQ